ncbi:MGMT family protein [Oceanobacillus jeddahense]|uniref:MGMT family protein n=1 Tax=Oceanobacillus jeddahense TaxID=1462527 RepID=A0ABY5JR29_9BACI|nr:MGMT family protein [Oceanobacillus jeddahense]UUI02778.1 MGMT family protein [Oceanobacillus jeddahense]
MTPFTEEVIKIIRKIPPGKVMTYGQIAREAGNPRAARQVVRVLHSMSKKHQLPWHRVINAKGQLAIPKEEANWEQRTRLEAEGVQVNTSGYVDLNQYQWFITEKRP